MTTQSKTYLLADPAAVAAKILAFNGPRLDPTKPTGEVETHGCKLSWVVANGSITITVVDKPFFISYGQIWNSVGELFGA